MRHIKLFESYNRYNDFLNILGLDYDILLEDIETYGELVWSNPKEILENKLDYLMDLYENSNDSILLYRIVFVKDVNDIDLKNLGLCYVSDLADYHEDMIDYLFQNAKKNNNKLNFDDCYLITIKVDNKNIDFKATLETFSLHPNENEITLKDGFESTIISITEYFLD